MAQKTPKSSLLTIKKLTVISSDLSHGGITFIHTQKSETINTKTKQLG